MRVFDDSYQPREMTARELDIVEDCLREFAEQQYWRATTASHWEEVAELIDPSNRNTFFYGNYNFPGTKRTDRQVDATGMMALGRFAAIVDSLLTPRNMFWHGLTSDNDYLNKQRGVRLYYEQLTKTLFKYRYRPQANFTAQNQSVYRSLGAYGTGGLFIDAYDGALDGLRGIRYKWVPIGELFLRENHQGLVDGYTRWFRLTAQQAFQKFGKLDTFPAQIATALKNGSQQPFDFIQCVKPRTDYDNDMFDYRRFPFGSYYISLTGKALMTEGGYTCLPMAPSRYEQYAGEMYGRSPAMAVLPALKTLNAEKKVFLKTGHRAADPVLLMADDGLVNMNMRPGAQNKGGVGPKGEELVKALVTGNVQITEDMMKMEQSLINDSFLVSLFQILEETPQMTATEVIERVNEKGILLAPTVGRQMSEYLGPAICREIAVLENQGLAPPMPAVMQEAKRAKAYQHSIQYTSPLARAMRAQEAAGFVRSVETVKEVVNITGDPSYLDPFDFETALPEIADIQGVPESWMASPEKIAEKRKARAQAQQRQEAIQAAPAQAAMMKAQAAMQKAGNGAAPAQAPAQGGAPLASQLTGG